MDENRKKSLVDDILMYVKEKSGDLLYLSAKILIEPNKFIRESGYSLYGGHSKGYIARRSYNLKRSPYFVFKDNKFYLSSKGRMEIIKNVIEEKKKLKKWDKRWRAVIFDIPESRRNQRNFLRKELKWMGFKELQHSIWITPYNIEKELLFLLKLWHIDFSGDIRFLLVDKIINDADLSELFTPQK